MYHNIRQTRWMEQIICMKANLLMESDKIPVKETERENAMQLNAHGLSHIGLRVTDVTRAKRFYVDTLGSQLVREIDGAVLINMYGMYFALYGDDSHSSSRDRFDPFRVGLDHIALAIEDPNI